MWLLLLMRDHQLRAAIKTQLVESGCSRLEAVYQHSLQRDSFSWPSPPCPAPLLCSRPPIRSPFCRPSRLFLAQIKVPITIIGTLQINCPVLEECPVLKSGLPGGCRKCVTACAAPLNSHDSLSLSADYSTFLTCCLQIFVQKGSICDSGQMQISELNWLTSYLVTRRLVAAWCRPVETHSLL